MTDAPELVTVYVYLPDEGVDCWRPVSAERVDVYFRLLGPVPDGERWEFPPGALVRCAPKRLSGGECLVAVAPA